MNVNKLIPDLLWKRESTVIKLPYVSAFVGKVFRRDSISEEETMRHEEEERARASRRRQERIEWNQKIQVAKRHLVGAKDWRDPHGKAEFIAELFGERVPDYLWYEFTEVTTEEMPEVVKMFWPSRGPDPLDIEAHRNLRIRNAEIFHPEIRLSTGKVLPLDQVGYVYPWDYVNTEGFPTGSFNFSCHDKIK